VSHIDDPAILKITTIGALSIRIGDEELELPSSLKTRALFAYLVLSDAPRPRHCLCDLFWENVDDPLAGLRWSLSKLRSILNSDGKQRLETDRKHISILANTVQTDWDTLERCANEEGVSEVEADAVWRQTSGVLLSNCELSNNAAYTAWLEGRRNDLLRLKGLTTRRFALDRHLDWPTRHLWAQRWRELEPFSTAAAKTVVRTKHHAAGREKAEKLARQVRASFVEAGLIAPNLDIEEVLEKDTVNAPKTQEIRFVAGKDGVSIAWASVGENSHPPLVKAANWLSHLELDWDSPIWSPLFRELSSTHRVIRYDERGCGLSDWDVDQITYEDFVEDLEQVVEASGVEKFPLLGISQGAAVSIEYAARHPERVSKLILFGAYDAGWRLTADEQEAREREAVMVLIESGWGSDNPAYRHLFSRTFMPDANPDELNWFDEFQRQTTSSQNALRFLEAFSTIDVCDQLPKVQCPTLVVHSRGDLRIPLTTGKRIAARIPNAQFAGISSSNHLLLGREKASQEFLTLVRDFLKK